MEDKISAAWPLPASDADDSALPPPWHGDVDLSDEPTESALLVLRYSDPRLVLNVCRGVFTRAEARGDEQAALHALHLASVTLHKSEEEALSDHVSAIVRERARGLGLCRLSARIDVNYSVRLEAQGEHAQAMVFRQKALEAAMVLGDARILSFALSGLANACSYAGQDDLALRLGEQLEPLLAGDDVVVVGLTGVHANTMALTWKRMAQAREADGDHRAAKTALRRARELALRACAHAATKFDLLAHLETLVRILMRLDEVDEARDWFNDYIANLDAAPSIGSDSWCLLELTRLRIDMRYGRASERAVAMLESFSELTGPQTLAVQDRLGDVRHVLLQAQEQLGRYEQALSLHKSMTAWRSRQRLASMLQRMKMLRHTVLAMRAEATEFIAHDLLTPLAAARTSLQALQRERLAATLEPSLHNAHGLLARATALSEQYLGVWRAELTPRAQLQMLDLGALVDDVCEHFEPPALAGPVHLQRDLRIGTCIRGDRVLLMRTLTVLLVHAVLHAHAASPVVVRLSAGQAGAASKAVLSIAYHGRSASAAVRTRIYQRFADGAVRDDKELGWLLVSRIAQLHRASIRFTGATGGACGLQLTFATVDLLHDEAGL